MDNGRWEDIFKDGTQIRIYTDLRSLFDNPQTIEIVGTGDEMHQKYDWPAALILKGALLKNKHIEERQVAEDILRDAIKRGDAEVLDEELD